LSNEKEEKLDAHGKALAVFLCNYESDKAEFKRFVRRKKGSFGGESASMHACRE